MTNSPNDIMVSPDWWKRIDPGAKLVSAVLALMLAGAALSGYFGLPGQVKLNQTRIDSLSVEHHDDMSEIQTYLRQNDNRWDRVLCHLEEMRQNDPQWERCER